jgi:hypothetical protein
MFRIDEEIQILDELLFVDIFMLFTESQNLEIPESTEIISLRLGEMTDIEHDCIIIIMPVLIGDRALM